MSLITRLIISNMVRTSCKAASIKQIFLQKEILLQSFVKTINFLSHLSKLFLILLEPCQVILTFMSLMYLQSFHLSPVQPCQVRATGGSNKIV